MWVQDSPGAPERDGCMVAEGLLCEGNTESPQGEKRSETKFTPEGVPVKMYTRVSWQTKWVDGKRRCRLQHFDDHTHNPTRPLKQKLTAI